MTDNLNIQNEENREIRDNENIDISRWVKSIEDSLKLKFDEFSINGNFIRIGNFILTQNKRLLWEIDCEENKKHIYSKYQNGIYIITCNDYIVKIGGTKVGMEGRISSYHCGHCIPERKKKNGENYPGKMSVTNAYIYNTIYYMLLNNQSSFSLYYYPIEDIEVTKNIFSKETTFKVQCYDEYEKIALNLYKDIVGEYPILSDNNHP